MLTEPDFLLSLFTPVSPTINGPLFSPFLGLEDRGHGVSHRLPELDRICTINVL